MKVDVHFVAKYLEKNFGRPCFIKVIEETCAKKPDGHLCTISTYECWKFLLKKNCGGKEDE